MRLQGPLAALRSSGFAKGEMARFESKIRSAPPKPTGRVLLSNNLQPPLKGERRCGGYTSSVTFGDSFPSRGSLFLALLPAQFRKAVVCCLPLHGNIRRRKQASRRTCMCGGSLFMQFQTRLDPPAKRSGVQGHRPCLLIGKSGCTAYPRPWTRTGSAAGSHSRCGSADSGFRCPLRHPDAWAGSGRSRGREDGAAEW